ncbi:MAG: hypothetical protein ACJAS1_001972 [Oleiphilaceae bacterium]|jgi:hypothetical protein
MPNKNKPLSFTLFDLERAIAQKNHNLYEKLIIELLDFMDQTTNLESVYSTDSAGNITCIRQGLVPLHNKMTFHEKQDIYSRLAATITAYLSDIHHTPNDSIFVHFIIFKNYIAKIFYLSCYANMDHILFNRDLVDGNFGLKLKAEQDIKYFYTCLTLNTDIEFDARQLANALPYFGMYWYLGMLYGFHHPYNKRIESNFNKIFDAHPVIKDMEFDSTAAELAASPWMLCSYLDRNDRHEMKVSINKAMEKWLSKQIDTSLEKQIAKYITETSQVKHIVVLSEKYDSKHAMYRSFHKPIMELKKHYQVTLVTAPEAYDEISAKDFDNIIEIKDTAENISQIISKIVKLKPDLIFYPSLGMAKWTIPLCNLRLAKYQMMTYGHPSSAFSNFIDFGATSGFQKGPDYQNFMMEQLVITGPDTFMTRVHDYIPPVIKKNNNNTVKIAVNSSIMKITPRFLNLCILLKQHSSVPIKFHFFLIKSNTAFEKSIYNKLGSHSVIHSPQPYNDYMQDLSNCNLSLGTFPFGGSNSNIDLVLLGIPKLVYTECSDLASYTDIATLKRLNLPDILFSSTEAEFLTNAIYLIHDSVERERISDILKGIDLDAVFFKEREDHQDRMLLDAINYFVDNKAINY